MIEFDEHARRLLQGRDAQPPLGHRAVRRGRHGHRRGHPRPDGHGPGRQPDRQHRRLLLRPAGHAAGRRAQGRAAPAAGDARRGGRRARLRQPHGHPHGQRRGLLRRAVPGQPAGLLRHGGPDAARQVLQGAARRATPIVVVGGRTGRDGIHGATFSQRRADARRTRRSSPTPCRSATPSPRRRCSTRSSRPATLGLYTAITDCGAGGLSSAVGEMGEELGAEVHLDRVPLKYAGPVLRRNLDLRGPGADGAGRAAGERRADPEALRRRGRRGHRHRHVRHGRRPQAAAVLRRARSVGRAGHGLPARRPARARPRRPCGDKPRPAQPPTPPTRRRTTPRRC